MNHKMWILLIFVISVACISQSANICLENRDGITVCVYRSQTGPMSKTDSESLCNSTTTRGNLLELFSVDMTNFVNNRLYMDGDNALVFWIGLSRVGPGEYRWDTSKRNTTEYENWKSTGTPNGDCVVMNGSDGTWSSRPCTIGFGYICQLAATSTTKQRDVTTPRDNETTTTTEKALTSQTYHNSTAASTTKQRDVTTPRDNEMTTTAEKAMPSRTYHNSTETTQDTTMSHKNAITTKTEGVTSSPETTSREEGATTTMTSESQHSTSGLHYNSDGVEGSTPCKSSLSLQERLSNATVLDAHMIIVIDDLTAEDVATVQDWLQSSEYVGGTEQELYTYTTEYLKIFDQIIASSNEDTFDIANPAVFADACNAVLENYAHRSSTNKIVLAYPNIECELVKISTDSFDGYTSNFNTDNQDETRLKGVIAIQNDWMGDYTDETGNSTLEIISVMYQTSSVKDFRNKQDDEIVSNMVSISVLLDGETISVPVIYGMELDQGKVNDVTKETTELDVQMKFDPTCVFWDTLSEDSDTGIWNTYGCTQKSVNATYVQCQCNHTTNFAILMRTTEVTNDETHEAVLSILSLIGLGISTGALFLTILILLCLPSLKSDRVFIHKHLVMALIIAQVLFMSTAVAVNHELICKLVAISLHYFYLAVFVWMLIEGVHLYLEIVQVFSRFDGKSKTVHYIIGGWGIPFIIVAVSVAVRWSSYGEGQGCWLSVHDGLIWAFLGPIALVILVNFVILLLVVRVVYRASSARGKEDAEYKHLTAALKGALFLLPLLGLSWAIGFMTINEGTLVFQYLFVILNSLQGLFIFLFYCAMNKEVRGALSRRFSRVALESGESKSISLRAVVKFKSTSPVLRFTDDTSGGQSISNNGDVINEPVSASGISVHPTKSESQPTLTRNEDNKSPFSPEYD